MEQELEKQLKELIKENGIRVDGIGILPAKLDKIIELLDRRVAFLLSMQEKKLDKIIELLNK